MTGSIKLTISESVRDGHSGPTIKVDAALECVGVMDKMYVLDAVASALQMNTLDILAFSVAKNTGMFDDVSRMSIDEDRIRRALKHED